MPQLDHVPDSQHGEQPSLTSSSTAQWGAQAVQSLLRRMLDSADDVLFALSERTTSDEQRRSYFDSMRLLRRAGAEITHSFEQALKPRASAVATAVPAQAGGLRLREDAEVEEEITVSNIVGRVEGAAPQTLWELRLRIQNVPAASVLRPRLEILRPKELANAFRDALQPLLLTSDVRLILYKLFERQLLADSGRLYEELNTRLASEGYSSDAVAPKSAARNPPPAAASRNGVAPASAATTKAEPFYSLSPSLLQAMEQWGATGGTAGIDATVSDSSGAGARMSAAPSYSLPPSLLQAIEQWGAVGTTAAGINGAGEPSIAATAPAPAFSVAGGPQRLSLVSQLLDETGRNWPQEDLQALRRLIQPIVRIALSDASFFADAAHPARELIAGLDSLAAEPAAARAPRLAEVEAALQSLQHTLSVPSRIDPLDGAALVKFLASQRSPRNTTSARLNAGRLAAHLQVKSVGSGHDLPVGLGPFLKEIWMPLVAALGLRFGAGTSEWERSEQLLRRLFGECRWVPGNTEPTLVPAILEDVSAEMTAMGVPDKLVGRATELLRSGFSPGAEADRLLDLETLGARAPSDPAARLETPASNGHTDEFAIDSIADWRASLPFGSWFRVFDRTTDRTLWMTADVFYPEASKLSFTGFDSEIRVTVDKIEFLGDLQAGRAEPVNPTETQSEAIARLNARMH